MTLGTTYNNPFNVSGPYPGFAGFGGSIVGAPGQGGYAAFPTLQQGWDAGVTRLNQYMTNGYNGSGPLNTIASLNPIYATDTNWGAGVSRASGIGLNTPLDPNNPTQMGALQRGIVTQEQGAGPANSIFGQVNNGGATTATTGDGSNVSYGTPDPNSGDITGYQVAGVNAPLDAGDGASPQSIATTPMVGGGAGMSGVPGTGVGQDGTTFQSGGGAPETVTNISQAGGDAGKSIQSGLGTAGTDVENAAGGIAGTLASIGNAVQSYTTSAFVMLALVVLGIIFVAFGLGMFGKRANILPIAA